AGMMTDARTSLGSPVPAGFASMRTIALTLVIAWLAPAAAPPLAARAAEAAPSPADVAFFERSVRPVLVERCYSCHSATAKKAKGGLSLDTRAGVMKGGDSGPAVVPG